ncbi:MAG: GNAT family N-acetyltransferase [Phormidesmis sp.]
MFGYTVRLAKETDIEGLPEVERAAAQRFLPYLSQLEISAELLEGLTPRSFLRRAQAERRLWVAVPMNAVTDRSTAQSALLPVGFIVAKFLPESCFIVELSVHPDHGRQGVGRALIAACCQGAKARGAEWVTLTTFRYVPWNIPFYQRSGFELLQAKHWSPELRAIVQHEARYGFAQKHRVVMARPSALPVDSTGAVQ